MAEPMGFLEPNLMNRTFSKRTKISCATFTPRGYVRGAYRIRTCDLLLAKQTQLPT